MKLNKNAIGAVLVFWTFIGFVVALTQTAIYLSGIYGDWVFDIFLGSIMVVGFTVIVYSSVVEEDRDTE
jgi:hypothetical protein